MIDYSSTASGHLFEALRFGPSTRLPKRSYKYIERVLMLDMRLVAGESGPRWANKKV